MTEGTRSVRVTFKGGLVGRLFKVDGSDRWYYSYWHDGVEYRETTKTADFKKAKTILKAKLEELAAVRRGAEPFVAPKTKRTTVDELLKALTADFTLRNVKGLKQTLSHMKPLYDTFGPWRAVEATPAAVDREIERWLVEGVAPATINRRTQILGQAFRFGHARRLVASVPTFRHLRENNARRGVLAAATFDAVVKALPDHLRDVASFAYHTGWRKGEILSLTAANVDMKLGELRIGDSKNGEGRVIPLRNEDGSLNVVGEIVQRRMAARVLEGDRVTPLLFHNEGRPIVDFRTRWAAACETAGCPGTLFHDLRRTFASDAVEAGSDYKSVMDWTGHKTTAMFMRYRITSLDSMRRAAQRTASFRDAQPKSATVVPLAATPEGGSQREPRKKHGKIRRGQRCT